MAVAEISYIGGYEGPTEYWWMRISPEGKRTQVTEPKAIPYPPHTDSGNDGGGKGISGTSNVKECTQAAVLSSPSPAPETVPIVESAQVEVEEEKEGKEGKEDNVVEESTEAVSIEKETSNSSECAAAVSGESVADAPPPAAVTASDDTAVVDSSVPTPVVQNTDANTSTIESVVAPETETAAAATTPPTTTAADPRYYLLTEGKKPRSHSFSHYATYALTYYIFISSLFSPLQLTLVAA